MKRILLIVVLFALAGDAWCQTSLLNIGGSFGSTGEYQFGIDKGSVVGGCVQRELANGQWLAGPCRDVFVLQKKGLNVLHLGGAVMYNAEHGNPNYDLRIGANVGAATSALLSKVAEDIPYLSSLGSLSLPPFLIYLGNITTADYAVGWNPVHTPDVNGNFRHGPMVMLNIPLSDVEALLLGLNL